MLRAGGRPGAIPALSVTPEQRPALDRVTGLTAARKAGERARASLAQRQAESERQGSGAGCGCDHALIDFTQNALCYCSLKADSAVELAAKASRAKAGSDAAPVLRIIEARWFSTVRWLIPRSAAMFLLG